jgi:hypothetical protein
MQMERIRPLSRNPAVTQVCDFWRATAMKTPCLWNQMSSDDEVSLRFYHRFQFPVHVHWSDESRPSKRKTQSAMDFDADPRGFSQIFENPARILSIDIFAHQMETIRTCLARMDGGPAPLLTSLSLFTDLEPTTDRYVPELEALRLPASRALSLWDVSVPWRADFMRGPHLRFLRLTYNIHQWEPEPPEVRPALATALAMLAGLPNLEYLSWTWALPALAPGMLLHTVPIPHLRRLALEGLVDACVLLMQHLSPAQPITVDVQSDGSDYDDAVGAALWATAARYWVPNTAAPPDAEVVGPADQRTVRIWGRPQTAATKSCASCSCMRREEHVRGAASIGPASGESAKAGIRRFQPARVRE